jgi:hypothetical protein
MGDIHSLCKIITAVQAGRIFVIETLDRVSYKSRSVFLYLSGTTDHLRGVWCLGCSNPGQVNFVRLYLIFVNLGVELATCQPCVMYDFMVASRFLEILWTLA